MKKGFTLVELSIVLVIIGLLIGGILVAQSMMSATKINSQVRRFQQFDIAMSNFKTKFGGLPGDNSKTFSGGNDNGTINDNLAFASNYHPSTEFARVWGVLSGMQMLQDGCPYEQWTGACWTASMPYGLR